MPHKNTSKKLDGIGSSAESSAKSPSSNSTGDSMDLLNVKDDENQQEIMLSSQQGLLHHSGRMAMVSERCARTPAHLNKRFIEVEAQRNEAKSRALTNQLRSDISKFRKSLEKSMLAKI